MALPGGPRRAALNEAQVRSLSSPKAGHFQSGGTVTGESCRAAAKVTVSDSGKARRLRRYCAISWPRRELKARRLSRYFAAATDAPAGGRGFAQGAGGPAPDNSEDTMRLTSPGPGLGLRRGDSDEIYILSVLLSLSADGPRASAQGPYIFFYIFTNEYTYS